MNENVATCATETNKMQLAIYVISSITDCGVVATTDEKLEQCSIL